MRGCGASRCTNLHSCAFSVADSLPPATRTKSSLLVTMLIHALCYLLSGSTVELTNRDSARSNNIYKYVPNHSVVHLTEKSLQVTIVMAGADNGGLCTLCLF
jgi:hypothetical protein